MPPAPQLAPAGTSSYNSAILHVGDGTWDASRDTFLLPNLQTLPLAVTQYNGMGNRFRDLLEYQVLILGHGVLAAITFLGVVPAAVMIARFYSLNPRMALRMHIWMQILTLFLTTIIFVLGWFAVGQERSLTNPHHDVGLTIYVLVWFQILWGWFTYRREKGKARVKTPMKLMVHQWLGRATALLALAQIGTGITLYGSPKALFILYALALVALILLYFFLSFRYQQRLDGGGGDGSYFSESGVDDRRSRSPSPSRHRRLKEYLGLGALIAGIAALRRNRRSHDDERTEVTETRHSPRRSSSRRSSSRRSLSRRSESRRSESRRSSSRRRLQRHGSGSYLDEKPAEHEEDHTWRDRLLGAAAFGGAIAALRGWRNRRRGRDNESSVSDSSYGQPLSGATNMTQTDVHRVRAGQAPDSPSTPRISRPGAAAAATPGTSPMRKPRPRRSGDSISSYTSVSDEHDDGHGGHAARNTIATLGLAGYAKHLWSKRSKKREDDRVNDIRRQDRIEEETARRNSQRRRFTGDGSPSNRRQRPPPAAGGSITTLSDSAITGSTPAISRPNLPRPGVPLSVVGPVGPSTAAITASQIMNTPHSNIPMPPPPSSSAIVPIPPPGQSANITLTFPPPPPISAGIPPEQSGSEAFVSAGGGNQRRHRLRDEATLGVGPGAAAQSSTAFAPSGQPHSTSSALNAPPVSVKLKMHSDGRHVTLRRLNEAEAAAEREARRRERRRRNGSVSSSASGDGRWRRVEAMEQAQVAPAAALQSQPGPWSASSAYPRQPQYPGQPQYPPRQPQYPPQAQHSTPAPGAMPPPPPHAHAPMTLAQQGHGMDLATPPLVPGMSALGSSMLSPPGTGAQGTETDLSTYDNNRRRRRAERMKVRAQQQGRTEGGRVEFQ